MLLLGFINEDLSKLVESENFIGLCLPGCGILGLLAFFLVLVFFFGVCVCVFFCFLFRLGRGARYTFRVELAV